MLADLPKSVYDSIMSEIFWAVLFGSAGALLFRLGNRMYLRLAGGESLAARWYVGAIGLTGAAAGALFCALILFMSFLNADFRWTAQQIVGVLGAAVVVSLFVAGATTAKIFGLRKLKRAGIVQVEDSEPEKPGLN